MCQQLIEYYWQRDITMGFFIFNIFEFVCADNFERIHVIDWQSYCT